MPQLLRGGAAQLEFILYGLFRKPATVLCRSVGVLLSPLPQFNLALASLRRL